jgi:hypothetical protein
MTYHDSHDPDLHDDTPYTPSTMTQAVIGGSIMLTIGLALYGAAMILQSLGATLAGLK